ncbi:DNA-packaging protein [Alteraurantiacibacter aquimixticola]|uniref:ATP-binding protein n=1 Tax=Alteraurantiacibacter aquimixticola TaxID=2489173 RepID=A0A4T3EXN6_9SPHN|nr:terminase family protein [Alteraurantiacibacter aquimixticola]TIX49389.1 ATP-binding protein [Alteraurantiacibacter aquimixticola]
MTLVERLDWIVGRRWVDRQNFLAQLTTAERRKLLAHWSFWAREEQLPPSGDWRVWLICAGRGFGKTRAGAEWVNEIARTTPDARIALIGSSIGEARAVMVEGESGIMACSADHARPVFEASLRRLTWPNGAQACLYSAAEPEGLRGPQHSHAWCDEIAKWDNSSDRALSSWNNLQMGLRLGKEQRLLATTTPRAVPLLRRLFDEQEKLGMVVTRGSTHDNDANLPASFIEAMDRQFGQSMLGRQELNGEMLEDIEGALWNRSLLESCRQAVSPEEVVRIVVGVDPPASAHGDACGIVVAGVTAEGQGKVLADRSVANASPEKWAREVAATMSEWQADRVIAEANQGGAMVESVLRAADCQMPIRLVHASRGKVARAEPIAALYEAGRVNHVGQHAMLEDELCGLMTGGSYQGPGRSPDRADALVWALTELMLTERKDPRVRRF